MSQDERRVSAALDLLLEEHNPTTTDEAVFRGAQYDVGLAWVWAEEGFGGLGVAPTFQGLVRQRLREAGECAQEQNFVGIYQAATAIHHFGTPAQKQSWLRPLFTYEEKWCQLFSEPGAGSDLGLATFAFRDGDEWVVNGQKVWTSGAQTSRWAILVARSDKDVPKHRGLTFFACDMRADGIEIRPLRQADGGSHFNEVYLTDVRIPDGYRIGDVGQGWGVSVAGLSSEREGMGITNHTNVGLPGGTDTLVALFRQRTNTTSPHAARLRDRIVDAWIGEKVSTWSTLRLTSKADGGANAASLLKIMRTRGAQASANLAVDLLGPEGMLGGDYDWERAGRERSIQVQYLRSRANSIEGGTSEIMRNIIGERVLGLPGDVRIDKDRPWREVPRS